MKPPFRIGFGFDVHRLEAGRKFMLGGVQLTHHRGASGHSDADVLIHAVCDALLGASGLRDIGFYFPDTEKHYKDIDSIRLLEEVMELLTQNKFAVGNIDVTVVLEAPKVNPHVEAMKEKLAAAMHVSIDEVSIKATTNERLGYVGREEGVAAYAVALIYSF